MYVFIYLFVCEICDTLPLKSFFFLARIYQIDEKWL